MQEGIKRQGGGEGSEHHFPSHTLFIMVEVEFGIFYFKGIFKIEEIFKLFLNVY